MHYPDDALAKFEEVSYLLKDNDKSKISKFLNVGSMHDSKAMTMCKTKITKASINSVSEHDEHEETNEMQIAGKVSNLFADFEVFEWANVSFGSDELYRLQLALVRLSISSKSDKVRLWGKLYGTHADYYVAEGFVQSDSDEDNDRAKTFEQRGTGINQFVYWVTNSPLDEWTMLPDTEIISYIDVLIRLQKE